MSDTILMIASGMKSAKKDYMEKSKLNLYLNYGLLGLATILDDLGHKNVRMFQGDYSNAKETINNIKKEGINLADISKPVFISIPSFFALEWTKDFIKECKKVNSRIKFIVGGRWVIDNNVDWVKGQLPEVSTFIIGFGETVIVDALTTEKDILKGDNSPVFKHFNYRLLYNFKKYQPVIEISRGCGKGCEFCLEKDYKVTPYKSPTDIMKEIEQISDLYESKDLNFYFEASIFNPTMEWSNSFYDDYIKKSMSFQWRFETRVDTLKVEVINKLAKSGLKVVDLGLESASIEQLLRMGKTTEPTEYLRKAEELLKVLYNNNIWAKINILLYPGETNKTLEETSRWLKKNKKYIKGVSVNPFILYLNVKSQDKFIQEIEKISSFKINEGELNKKGYTYVNLSKEIDINNSKDLTNKLTCEFMSEKDYLEIKEICYLKRDIKKIAQPIPKLMEHLRKYHKIDIDGDLQKRQLTNCGYFHGYKGYRFIKRKAPQNTIEYSEFKHIVKVIEYDMELKAILYPALMYLEMAIKNIVLNKVICGLEDVSFYNVYKAKMSDYPENIKLKEKRLRLRDNIHISLSKSYEHRNFMVCHYYNRGDEVPLWVIFENIQLGDFARFNECLNEETRIEIAKELNIYRTSETNCQILSSALYMIKELRNAVAHNNIIFDVRFQDNGSVKRAVRSWISNETNINDINFNFITDYIVLICCFLKKVESNSDRIYKLINSFIECNKKIESELPKEIYGLILSESTNNIVKKLKEYLEKNK